MSKLQLYSVVTLIAFCVYLIADLRIFEIVESEVPLVTQDEKEASRVCKELGGQNAGYYLKHDGGVVCTTKQGRKVAK